MLVFTAHSIFTSSVAAAAAATATAVFPIDSWRDADFPLMNEIN